MIRRQDGVKYLDIDGCSSIVHLNSTLENYLDRFFSFSLFGPEKLLKNGSLLKKGHFLEHYSEQECCYCHHLNKSKVMFPNAAYQEKCVNCNKTLEYLTFQISGKLHETLGIDGYPQLAGLGLSVLITSVPIIHSELDKLLRINSFNLIENPRWFEDVQYGAPWWPAYKAVYEQVNN